MALELGMRVHDGHNFFGTVRFLGLIPESPHPSMQWVGVEWDSVTRGKYDGSIYDVRYFTCQQGAGSFVKPHKLTPCLTLGAAFARRYLGPQPATVKVSCSYVVRQTEGGVFENLRVVDLSGQTVYTGEETVEMGIALRCPNLSQLNLSDNAFTSWDQILSLLPGLHSLEWLNVSHNRLAAPTTSHLQFPQLTTLIANTTDCQWAGLNTVLFSFPNLLELQLTGNHFTTVELEGVPCLTNLSLALNSIGDWNEIVTLRTLPLQKLYLGGNSFTAIHSLDSTPGPHFPSLKFLSLKASQVKKWSSLEHLNQFPLLEEVQIQEWPLFDGLEDSDRRKLAIAWLPHIRKLNCSNISPEEREAAERFAVRRYSTFTDPPPLYARLRGVHGDLQPLADICLTPPRSDIRVVVEGDELADFTLDLGWSMTEFRTYLADALHCKPSELQILHSTPENYEVVLKEQDRRLFTYRMRDGDEIRVSRHSKQ
eukprot:NODE_914_length_1770_cov_22.129032_g858_i0.p1 GENE.NODE_914_length_1770_cov_22.129032_g858_i0~~NODE_914_length_1770_cov_22.129032_g858_i0.p1  ORF type:complete len:501 (-),score=134.77 NODE_914_length_1770_cov_22.129032_g858_i0:267-1709(-)